MEERHKDLEGTELVEGALQAHRGIPNGMLIPLLVEAINIYIMGWKA